MYIIVYNPYDDFYHRDESWDVYDTENFDDYTKDGVESLISNLSGFRIEEVYTDKSKLPDRYLQYGRKDITWYEWDKNIRYWETKDLTAEIEEQRKTCEHKWKYPYQHNRTGFGGGGYDTWTRTCELCSHSETTSKSTVDRVERSPVF